MAEMAHYAQDKDYRRWTVPHHQFHRTLTERGGPAVELRARPDVRPRRAISAPAYRPGAKRLGDAAIIARSSTHARRVTGTKPAALLAGHLARTGLEVSELLEPGYDPVKLKAAVVDAGGDVPRQLSLARVRASTPAQ